MPGCVAIVIPNWNGAGRLKSLLEQLTRQTLPADRIIVVDNGSTDESVAVVKSAGAEVIGMAAGTTVGDIGTEIRIGGATHSVSGTMTTTTITNRIYLTTSMAR